MSVHKRHNWVMDIGLPAAFALVWGSFAVLFRLFGWGGSVVWLMRRAGGKNLGVRSLCPEVFLSSFLC